jgi:hypothetical protein
MLSAFGVFWVEEGLGLPWPGEDLAILVFCSSIPDGCALRCRHYPLGQRLCDYAGYRLTDVGGVVRR